MAAAGCGGPHAIGAVRIAPPGGDRRDWIGAVRTAERATEPYAFFSSSCLRGGVVGHAHRGAGGGWPLAEPRVLPPRHGVGVPRDGLQALRLRAVLRGGAWE